MEKMVDVLKSHYVIIGIVMIFIGLLISIYFGDVEFVPKQILTLDSDHQPVTKDYVFPKIIYPIAEFISSAVIPFGITLIITMFFVNNFTKQENEQLKNELLSFQNDTAENAVYSIFKQIIDPSFFEIVKNDVLNCKLIRRNAKWIYDIEEKAGKLVMTRTISYSVENLSTEKQTESIKVKGLLNSYMKTRVVSLQYDKNDGKGFNIIYDSNEIDHCECSAAVEENIEIEGRKSVEIIKIIEQTFTNNFIYETHFANEPLTDLEIQVNYPEGYSFSLNQCFWSQPVDKPIDGNKRKVFKFKNAILKGQGIEFFCEKKS